MGEPTWTPERGEDNDETDLSKALDDFRDAFVEAMMPLVNGMNAVCERLEREWRKVLGKG